MIEFAFAFEERQRCSRPHVVHRQKWVSVFFYCFKRANEPYSDTMSNAHITHPHEMQIPSAKSCRRVSIGTIRYAYEVFVHVLIAESWMRILNSLRLRFRRNHMFNQCGNCQANGVEREKRACDQIKATLHQNEVGKTKASREKHLCVVCLRFAHRPPVCHWGARIQRDSNELNNEALILIRLLSQCFTRSIRGAMNWMTYAFCSSVRQTFLTIATTITQMAAHANGK